MLSSSVIKEIESDNFIFLSYDTLSENLIELNQKIAASPVDINVDKVKTWLTEISHEILPLSFKDFLDSQKAKILTGYLIECREYIAGLSNKNFSLIYAASQQMMNMPYTAVTYFWSGPPAATLEEMISWVDVAMGVKEKNRLTESAKNEALKHLATFRKPHLSMKELQLSEIISDMEEGVSLLEVGETDISSDSSPTSTEDSTNLLKGRSIKM